MTIHSDTKGYYFNFLHDAAQCYWAARLLELNYTSIDEKDKIVDKLTIIRLRKLAEDLTNQAINGLSLKVTSEADRLQLLEQLVSGQAQGK